MHNHVLNCIKRYQIPICFLDDGIFTKQGANNEFLSIEGNFNFKRRAESTEAKKKKKNQDCEKMAFSEIEEGL